MRIDPFATLLGLRYKAHPWHGVEIGPKAPDQITCYIEMVSTDTVKYEVDKKTGYLTVDRPHRFSSILPHLYGFIPQTYCGVNIGERANEVAKRTDIVGDGDPLDICVLTEKQIAHGDLLVQAIPIGGLRIIDTKEADDKIIAVLKDDLVYGGVKDISELHKPTIDRMTHYFLTYKDMPGAKDPPRCILIEVYGADEAKNSIKRAQEDYKLYIEKIIFARKYSNDPGEKASSTSPNLKPELEKVPSSGPIIKLSEKPKDKEKEESKI